MRITMLKMMIVAFVIVLGLFMLNDSSAMDQCQKRHTFETCFYTLNR
jgi:hypothetical protein